MVSQKVCKAVNNERALRRAMKSLSREIDLKDLDEPAYILGIEFNCDKLACQIRIHQQKHIREIWTKLGMESCKPEKRQLKRDFLSNTNKVASKEPTAPMTPYQNLIGCLMYLAQVRGPDIVCATSYLSQFNNCFDGSHW